MILFFDAVSAQGYIGLYDTNRSVICSEGFTIAGNESSKCLGIIMDFLQQASVEPSDLTHIVCVAGPGSFTGIRTISLVVNSFRFTFPHIRLTSLSYFDLYGEYPIARASSKRDMFVKKAKSATIEIIKNPDFELILDEINYICGDIPGYIQGGIGLTIQNTPKHEKILGELSFQDLQKIAPLYIKKPNIS